MANRFLNNITINDAYTLPSTDGSDGQAIVTDGAGNLSFGSVAAASATSSESTHLHVKNTSGSLIAKGTPVYITGNVGNTDKLEIAPADASSASTMPAVGLLESDLANNGEGFVVQGGFLKGLVTGTIDGTSTSSNDTVYVKSGGGLTMTKPTGASNLIQNIAKVARVHGSNGSLVVSSILRANDVPNLSPGKIWVGDGNTIESTVVEIDETNNILIVDGKIYYSNMFATYNDLPSASTYHGMFAHVHDEGAAYYAHAGAWVKLAKHSELVDAANDATITLTAGTGLSGGGDFTTDQATNETITVNLDNTAVSPGSYGDSSNIPTITVDQQGRITGASQSAVNIPAGTTVGTAGNQVSGTVTLQGGGDTTVTQSGQTITISSTSSGGGGGGGELSIERDVFTATADQTAFAITSAITSGSNTQVYIDGVYQAKSNYTTSGSTITFSTGVPLGAEVEVVHFISILSKVYTDTFTGNGSTVAYTASKDVTDENVTQVYIDGVYQSKDNYTTSGTTITFSTSPPDGSAIEVVHFTAAEYSTLNSNQFTGTGSQTDFTLTQAVDIEKSFVFIQGVYQEKSNYSISGTTLTFTTAPLSGYSIEIITVGSVSIFNDTLFLDNFTGNGTLTDYTLSTTPASENAIDVYLNGIYQNKDTFTLSSNTLTFSTAPTSGTAIEIKSTGGLNNVVTSSGGGISWQTTPKTAAFTATAGEGYFVNTTSAAITVTLPSSPTAGDEVSIVDYAGTADTNNITITSSDNINGSSNGVLINYERGGVSMVYVDSTQGWIAYNAANETATALGKLPVTVEYLVVAGGGGGGCANGGGGGGGAGGYLTNYTGTALSLEVATNYVVTIGPGGAGGSISSNGQPGVVGSDSVFNLITSLGGGYGGGDVNQPGGNGGSGGGGARFSGSSGGSGTTSPQQGYDGGTGFSNTGGGGGGAGSAGANATSSRGGNGGNGIQSLITGTNTYRAGGGGGGIESPSSASDAGQGGLGGGGNGGAAGSVGSAPTTGTENTGGGGGGSGDHNTGGNYPGQNGGSGVVILRYPDNYTITETTSGGNVLTFITDESISGEKVTTFTAGDGTIQFST